MTDAEDTAHQRAIGTEIINLLRDYCLKNGVEASRGVDYLGATFLQLILSTAVPKPTIEHGKCEACRIINSVQFIPTVGNS